MSISFYMALSLIDGRTVFGDTVICKLKGRLQAVAKIRCALENPEVNSFDAADAHMHFFVSYCRSWTAVNLEKLDRMFSVKTS
ncbi:hypothetical protein STEG23_038352, partial [Scotinomys teguina]